MILACLLAGIGLGAVVVWFFFAHITLRVATGPLGSDGHKFFAAFVRTVADAYPRVRLRLVPTAESAASAQALTTGEVDLAVVRSDLLPSTVAQTIAIVRRDVVGLVVPPHTSMEQVRDLAGKTLGLVQGAVGDGPILDQLLAYYQIPADTVQRVVLAPSEIGPAIRQKRVAAMFALGPIGPGPLADVMTAVAEGGKGTPTLVEIEAAEAMAQRFPLLESVEIPAGAFGTTPLRPAESVTTLSVTMRLVHAPLCRTMWRGRWRASCSLRRQSSPPRCPRWDPSKSRTPWWAVRSRSILGPLPITMGIHRTCWSCSRIMSIWWRSSLA